MLMKNGNNPVFVPSFILPCKTEVDILVEGTHTFRRNVMTTYYRGAKVQTHVSENIDPRPTKGVYRGVKWHSEDLKPAPTQSSGVYRGVKWGN